MISKAIVLLSLIDQGEAFLLKSVGIFKNVKICSISITAIYLFIVLLIYMEEQIEDAPGLILNFGSFSLVPLVIGVFVGVLQNLLEQAVNIKLENDLVM